MLVSDMQTRVRAQLAISFCYHHGLDAVRALPVANKRLAVYRRTAMQAYENMTGCEKKLARAKAPHKIARWQDACDFWRIVAAVCDDKIRRMGETF